MADEQVPNGQGDFEGYQDLNGLKNGYRASSQEAKRLNDENRQMGARLQNLEQQFMQMNAVNQRQSVPQRGSTADRLAEQGYDPDLLAQYMDERLTPRFQQFLEPLVKAQQARLKIMAEEPDFAQFETKQAVFLQKNPSVSETYNAIFKENPEEAMRYLSGRYADAERENHKGGRRDVRQETIHAQIPGDRAGESRRQPEGQDLAVADARKNYDANPNRANTEYLAKMRLRQVITDDFLSQ